MRLRGTSQVPVRLGCSREVPFDIVGWVANDNGLDQSDITGRELGWVGPHHGIATGNAGPAPPNGLAQHRPDAA